MKIINFLCVALLGIIFFGGTASAAYDLPKIKIDKRNLPTKNDIETFQLFEQKIKFLLAENKNLPPDSPERIFNDNNLIFVAYYKGNAYFLNRYSVTIDQDFVGKQAWTQRIFPIGKKISPKNSLSTRQKFFTDGKENFNALKPKNDLALDKLTDEEEKFFLSECFNVGYFYAFNRVQTEK